MTSGRKIVRALAHRLHMVMDFARLALQSLASRWPVTMLNFIGIVLAVALLSNAGFFAQAVDRAILQQELSDYSRRTGRDPFSLQVYLFPTSRQPLSLAAAEQVADNLATTLAAEIGLPLEQVGSQVESGSMMLLPHPDDTRYADSDGYLESVEVAYVHDIADQMEIVAGRPLAEGPHAAAGTSPDTLDVWMHADLAAAMGLDVDETLVLGLNARQPIHTIRVAGLWRARDPADPFWFGNPDQEFSNSLIVGRGEYQRVIEPVLAAKARYAAWHIVLDDRPLNPAYAQEYVDGFGRAMTIIDRYLPGAKLNVSPLGPLEEFTGRQTLLVTQLLAFNLPALIFLLYFLLLVAQIVVRRQEQEISILVSRGMSRLTLLGMTLAEQLLLFLPAVPLGLLIGVWLARIMGNSAGFLRFAAQGPLPASFQGLDVRLVAAALLLALCARVIPVMQSASRTLLDQERARARPVQRPFWQRVYLDIILIVPTLYVYRQLQLQGSFADPTAEGTQSLLQDPLLVLAPALFVMTAALLVMRLFPLGMTFLDWIAARLPWFVPHMALRQLGRHSADYGPPLLLVIVLLALGLYTVSMAASLDQWLVDRVYYQTGADARFMPASALDESGAPVVVPPSTFEGLDGIAGAAGVGDYRASITVAEGSVRGRFLSVDRLTLPQVGWFRPDFAPESLGALMNRLALAPNAVLVSDQFLNENLLRVGDRLSMHVIPDTGIWIPDSFIIVGSYSYFPTVNEGETVIIGNRDYLLLMTGTEFPREYWVRFAPGSTSEDVQAAVRSTGLTPSKWRSAPDILAQEQAKLERIGIFGTLTIGFGAAAIMAVIALVMHGAASLRQRSYQFGVLRALGLDRRPLLAQVGLEYLLLTAYGTIAGSVIGIGAALLFTPFFRMSGGGTLPLPPLIPEIAWDQITAFALIFAGSMVVVESLLVARGLRDRLFSILRMGQIG